MDEIPFTYPKDDDGPYLEHFAGQFSSVFVALPPFLKLGFPPAHRVDDGISLDESLSAKRLGLSCGVSWTDVAALCQFPTIGHVNRALRLTGSRRILVELAKPEDTARLIETCSDVGLIPPDEGYISALMEVSAGTFLKRLGHENVFVANHFGMRMRKVSADDLLNPEIRVGGEEYCAEDLSVFFTTYTDYHYTLICQTAKSVKTAAPEDYFEGFAAGPATCDMWGVGRS